MEKTNEDFDLQIEKGLKKEQAAKLKAERLAERLKMKEQRELEKQEKERQRLEKAKINILIREKKEKEAIDEADDLENEIADLGLEILNLDPNDYSVFWYWRVINKDGDEECRINHRKFCKFIRESGFRRYDIGSDSIFVYLDSKVIEPVTITRIQDYSLDYIKRLPRKYMDENGYLKPAILNNFYNAPAIYFNPAKMSLIGTEKDLNLNSDTADYCYIYYNNVAVRCSASGAELLSYLDIDGYVFKDQIKERRFELMSGEGMFCEFIRNVTRRKNDDGTTNDIESENRFNSLRTCIGYLMHSYYETKLKAVNLTDSVISDSAEGRTGKTLLGHAIAQIKNVCEISGKDFDPANKHKYAEANLDTQIVFLNDIKKRFDFEYLFNDISDSITVDKKNQHPFKIRAKILLSSNSTFRVEGASAKDRVYEFEFSDHYSDTHQPKDDFKGVWFFKDWKETDWLLFDNFMIECIVAYLKHGLIESEPINLIERKLSEHTNPDFVEFINNAIKNEYNSFGIKICNNWDINKKELHNKFIEEYPDYKDDRYLKTQRNFITLLKRYAKISGKIGPYYKERKSGSNYYIRFSGEKIFDSEENEYAAKTKIETQLEIF